MFENTIKTKKGKDFEDTINPENIELLKNRWRGIMDFNYAFIYSKSRKVLSERKDAKMSKSDTVKLILCSMPRIILKIYKHVQHRG